MKISIKYVLVFAIIVALIISCQNKETQLKDIDKYAVDQVPNGTPLIFKPNLTADNILIHKGLFSPDLSEYYYTVSDEGFAQFDVKVIQQINGTWSTPTLAFFNSEYNEHGMSFSPDGNSIYFSSTRPTGVDSVSDTWHIWKSEKIDSKWADPVFVNIPNLNNKLVSHPTVTQSGMMYFHSSNLDYSEMDIYYAEQIKGEFQAAKKVSIPDYQNSNMCTPYISPDGSQLIFAIIGDQLDLVVASKNESNVWSKTKTLDQSINTNGQGNPSITSDGKYLLFTTGSHSQLGEKNDWEVKWVNMESILR